MQQPIVSKTDYAVETTGGSRLDSSQNTPKEKKWVVMTAYHSN